MTTRKEFAAISRTDFCAFAQQCFVDLNPDIPLKRNWHHEAIAYNLDQVFRGEVKRLIINAPPRGLKSLIGSVAFQPGSSASSLLPRSAQGATGVEFIRRAIPSNSGAAGRKYAQA